MLSVGLTGGIGSGKSTVAGIFGVLGIPVSNADQVARAIMNEDPALRRQIIQHFGEEAYLEGSFGHGEDERGHGEKAAREDEGVDRGGALNRSFLAAQVFHDPEKLALLNSLVHPATIRAGEEWLARQSAHTPYAIREAALIFESRSSQSLDFVIGVYAPATLRIHRTMQRDKITREEVLQRMKNQIDEDIKMRLCDAVIYNDDQQAVLPQVLELHKKLIRLAAGSE